MSNRMMLLPHSLVPPLHVLQYLLLLIRFLEVAPATVYNIESKSAIWGEKQRGTLYLDRKRTLFHWFVAHTIKVHISIPFSSYQRASLYCLILPNALNALFLVNRQQSINCLFGNFEDTTCQVCFSDFLLVFIQFLLIFTDAILKVCSTSFLQYISSPW